MRDSSCKLHEVCDMMTGGTTYLSNLEDICCGTRGGITLGVQVAEVVGDLCKAARGYANSGRVIAYIRGVTG